MNDIIVGLACIAIAAVYLLVFALCRASAAAERRAQARLAADAAFWGEPTRVEVESPWLFDADEFSDYDAEVARLRSELDNPSAVVLWLGGGAR